MAYVIKSKYNETKIDFETLSSSNNKGNSIGKNRIFTVMNEQLDDNLKKSSKLLYCIVSYLFQSNNYIHDSKIANGKRWGQKLYGLFSFICLIVFISLLITGVASPFIQAFNAGKKGDAEGFGKELAKAFSSSGNIVVLSLAAFFMIVSLLYLILILKIRKNNGKLSLEAYLSKKLSYCLKLRFLIKAEKQILLQKDLSNKDVFILENFEVNGDNDKWSYLQMYNLMASIFIDLKFMFVINQYDEKKINYLNEVIKWDFKNIEIIEIEGDIEEAIKKRNEAIINLDIK